MVSQLRLNKRYKYKRLALSPPQILVLGFASIILIGAVLLTMPGFTAPGRHTDFLTALFTATSAVCVTGLVVVDTGTHWAAPGQVLIMLLIQIGGLGFMTMAVIFFIVTGKKIGLRNRLLIRESLNQISIEGVVRLVKMVLLFALVAELLAACILGFWWGREAGPARGAWLGLFHAVSAFNNAGFDLFGDFRSMTAYVNDPAVNLVITSLFIIGGLGFSVVYDLWKNVKDKKRLSVHSRMVITVSFILLAAGTVLFMALEWGASLKDLPLGGKLMASYFQGATPRTAGFNTVDLTSLRTTTLFMIIILMFIGASPGSTGGGIKTTTFSLLLLASRSVLAGREDIEVYNKRIPFHQVYKSLAIFLLAASWVVLVAMVLTISEKADFLTILFETVSAFGTVGLSMGITPELSQIGRIMIILTMFLGRLGPVTVAFALAQKRVHSRIRLPEEKIIVG
ncbi:MAG: TrkH family potassium uptake protein [Peptococcaceae bacterium]|nr:TrkH family potassium uptake protein [Peptococcaceae bacterium]